MLLDNPIFLNNKKSLFELYLLKNDFFSIKNDYNLTLLHVIDPTNCSHYCVSRFIFVNGKLRNGTP